MSAVLSTDDDDGNGREWGGLAVVLAAHVVVLGGLAVTLKKPELLSLPTVIGVLVPQQAVEPPKSLPMEPQPKPRPVVKPKPMPIAPPVPQAPLSERAISAPPPEPMPEASPPAAPPAPPAPEAPPAPKEPPAPVVPPRSDAAHLNNPAPSYPNLSRRLGEQGRVLFDVFILPDGSVGEIKLKVSSGFPRLDEAALQAVRHWLYVPAKRGDTPIPYWYVQPIVFSIDS
ncbi:MAG: energy transducer TonB [Pseudomonadota bacterium]